MIADIEKFLKREGEKRSVKIDIDKKVRKGETKKEREKRFRTNSKLLKNNIKKLLKANTETHFLIIKEYSDNNQPYYYVPENNLAVDDLIIDSITYYNNTGNLLFSIECCDKRLY